MKQGDFPRGQYKARVLYLDLFLEVEFQLDTFLLLFDQNIVSSSRTEHFAPSQNRPLLIRSYCKNDGPFFLIRQSQKRGKMSYLNIEHFLHFIPRHKGDYGLPPGTLPQVRNHAYSGLSFSLGLCRTVYS